MEPRGKGPQDRFYDIERPNPRWRNFAHNRDWEHFMGVPVSKIIESAGHSVLSQLFRFPRTRWQYRVSSGSLQDRWTSDRKR